MKKIIHTFALSLFAMLAFSACEMNEEITLPGNDTIVLDLSAGQTKLEDTPAEAYVHHIDVFIFREESGVPATRVHYGRYVVNNASSLTLNEKKSFFQETESYYVYLVANSHLDEAKLRTDILTYEDLLNQKQEDLNLHVTALSSFNGAPEYFLMDAVARDAASQSPVKLNTQNPTENIVLQARLKRAAAKVVINIEASDEIEFKSYGLADGSDGGLYYIRNLPVNTYLLEEAKSADNIVASRRTTPHSVNAYFTWNPQNSSKKVSLTTYVYPHHWDNESILEHETSVIMNLPMDYTSEGETIAFHNSWYKIPMTDDQKFERNNYYEVNIQLNRPGAITEVTPVPVEDIHYDVKDWTEVSVRIDGEDRPKYLMVSRDTLEMHNIAQDATSLEFASSSPVTIAVKDVHYYNKFSQKTDASARNISGTTPAGSISGNITVNSPVPTNNAIRYFTLVVTNEEGLTREVFVIQYPLEYITNLAGWYSYREDFYYRPDHNNDKDNQAVPTTWEVPGDYITTASFRNSQWDYTQSSTGGAFTSKVAQSIKSSGLADIDYYYYTYNNRYGLSQSTTRALTNGNPRMYHVQIKSTSSTYTVAIPQMDADGYTDNSSDNARLVSPSFMIASQLGAVSSGAFNNFTMAASHCRDYVEVYKDPVTGEVIHLDNWRLPTRAEVEIIIKFQNDSEVMDEVLAGRYYWCADTGRTGNYVENTDYTQNGIGLRCIRDAY